MCSKGKERILVLPVYAFGWRSDFNGIDDEVRDQPTKGFRQNRTRQRQNRRQADRLNIISVGDLDRIDDEERESDEEISITSKKRTTE